MVRALASIYAIKKMIISTHLKSIFQHLTLINMPYIIASYILNN